MERLRQRDLRTLLSYAREIYAERDLDGFATHLVSTLPKVVPSEMTTYDGVNPSSRTLTWVADPVLPGSPELAQIFERHMHEHPLVNHFRRTGDGHAAKLSDFVTRSRFHRLGLYNEFYRRVGLEHEMATIIPAPPPIIITIAVNRSGGKDFSERDRLLLDLLRPHLVQAHQNAESMARMRREMADFERAAEELDRGMVAFAGKGGIQWLTARAREWLSEYFERPEKTDHLPESLKRWVECQRSLLSDNGDAPRSRKPLVLERAGKRLAVRLVDDPTEDRRILLMEESFSLSAAPLEHLGLTSREAEILLSIARGRPDKEIAATLHVSPRTVNKHLEHIYRKLEVGSRTEAVSRTLEIFSLPVCSMRSTKPTK